MQDSSPGTLEMTARRYGLLGGVRFLRGNVWRLIVGADAGAALSSFSSIHLIDDSNPSGARDYGLTLPDKTSTSGSCTQRRRVVGR